MRTFFLFIVLAVIALSTSCRSIVKNTLGRYIYKKEFMPSPIGKNNFFVEIPYELHDGWIFLKVKLNGKQKDYDFIFDTGSRTSVSDSVAKELNLFSVGSKRSYDINGYLSNTDLYKISVSFDKFSVHGLGASSEDFTHLTNGCLKADGIIGNNILGQGVFHFDCERKVLIITNSIKNIPKEKIANHIKLRKAWDGDSFVKLKFNSHKGKFIFDTGCANFLLIKSNFFIDEIPIKKRIGCINAFKSTKMDTVIYYANDGTKIGGLSIMSYEDNYIKSFQANTVNLFGNEIFKSHHVTIDSKHGKLYLSSNLRVEMNQAQLAIPNLKVDWKNGRVFISALTIDSKLQKMGLQINDTILSINNFSTASLSDYCEFRDIQKKLENVDEMNITIQKMGNELKYKITKEILYE